MQEEKKAEIKKSLENFQKQLDDLRRDNPNGNYEYLEKLIETLSAMLDGVDNKKILHKLILKKILFSIILYGIYLLMSCVVLGFSARFLGFNTSYQLLYIIPIVSAILFVTQELTDGLLSSLHLHHPFALYFLSNFIVILILVLVDNSFFHICADIWQGFVILISISATAIIGELYLAKKFIFL